MGLHHMRCPNLGKCASVEDLLVEAAKKHHAEFTQRRQNIDGRGGKERKKERRKARRVTPPGAGGKAYSPMLLPWLPRVGLD